MKSTRTPLAIDGLWTPTIDALFAAAVVCFNALLAQLLQIPAPTAVFAVLFAAFVIAGVTVRRPLTLWLRMANIGLRGSVIFGLGLALLWKLGLLATTT